MTVEPAVAQRPRLPASDHLASDPLRVQLLCATCVFLAALAFAGIYESIARGTYDFDEFVYLLLGHAFAHGRVPYASFPFYHPPGIMVTMAVLDPLIRRWWVWGRVISFLLDAGTCALVFLVARRFLSRRVAIVAGLLCASSPIMLSTGTRIMPDVYIMFFSFLAIYLLLVRPSNLFAVLAGVAFGIAVIYKYPALLTLPACVLAAGRRRRLVFLAATAITTVALISPFLPYLHQLYEDTVVFQGSRSHNPIQIRVGSILLYAVLLQPLGFFGMWVKPRRWWLVAGYLSGFVYLAASQVYYHYMLPIVPFASILGAAYLAQLPRMNLRRIVPLTAVGATAVTLVWAAAIEYTPGFSAFHVTAAQAGAVTPVSAYIRARTSPSALILDDRPDLPFLAYRRNCDDYFWNDQAIITAQQLNVCLTRVRYIIHFFGSSGGFPPGFLDNVDQKWCRRVVGSGANGAFVYDLHCVAPYIPVRN